MSKGINDLDALPSDMAHDDQLILARSNVLYRANARDVPTSLSQVISFTPPTSSDFSTWVNQAGSVVTDLDDGMRISHDNSNTSATSFSCRVRTLPGGSWDVRLGCVKGFTYKANLIGGLCLRESGTGKLVQLAFGQPNTGAFAFGKTAGPTTLGTVYNNMPNSYAHPVAFFRLIKSGSNIIPYLSYDGLGWTQFGAAVALTDGFTTAPDQWGCFIDTFNNGTPNLDVACDFIHWSE